MSFLRQWQRIVSSLYINSIHWSLEEFMPVKEYILTEHDKNKIAASIIMLINDEELRKKLKIEEEIILKGLN